MIPSICRCGIACRFWLGDVAVCPRCRVIYMATPNGVKVIEGQPSDLLIEEVENFMRDALAVFAPELSEHPDQGTFPFLDNTAMPPLTPEPEPLPEPKQPCLESMCDQCGSPIAEKCGSVCKNCGWIKPCSLE